jgi:biopolymer transport protein ExbD
MSSILRHLIVPGLLVALCAGPAPAAPPALNLHILSEGRVRIEDGPVMNMRQFRAKLESLKKQHPQPDLVTRSESNIPFGAFMVVMQTVRDAQYDAHLIVPDPAQDK